MTIVIDPLTAVIFFIIGFLAGATFAAIRIAIGGHHKSIHC